MDKHAFFLLENFSMALIEKFGHFEAILGWLHSSQYKISF